MFDDVGIANSAGVCTALMVGVSIIPTIFIQLKGRSWHGKQEMKARI